MFHRVRDLHPVLFGRAAQGAAAFAPWQAGRASVANAFAVEWVAPVERVRTLVAGRGRLDLDELGAIARQARAPLQAILHQVENHGLATVDTSVGPR